MTEAESLDAESSNGATLMPDRSPMSRVAHFLDAPPPAIATLFLERRATQRAMDLTARHKRPRHLQLLDLPIELCELLLGRLDCRSLSRLACACQALNQQSSRATLWKTRFEQRWGSASKNQNQAAEIAGSWKALYISKQAVRDVCPCKWEVRAALEKVTACASPKGLACCAVIDGSGSMCAGDFETMTDVVGQLSAALKDCPNSQLAVIQFSGRTQVEVPLQNPANLDCAAVMKGVTRMNGGTNVAAAIFRAAVEMESLDVEIQRVIIFMSDFRIDEFSAKEAVTAANSVSKDSPKTTYFAFGVGRLVDYILVQELIDAGCPAQTLSDGYLSLGYQEDSSLDDY